MTNLVSSLLSLFVIIQSHSGIFGGLLLNLHVLFLLLHVQGAWMAIYDLALNAYECPAADSPLAWFSGEGMLDSVLKFGGTDMLSMASRASMSSVSKSVSLAVAKNFGLCIQNGNVVYYEAWKKAPLNEAQKQLLDQMYDCAVCLMPDKHGGFACSTTATWCVVAEHKRSNLWLTRGDLAPLFMESKWLSGEVINNYLEILRDRTLEGTGRPLAIFSTLFAPWLEDPVNIQNPGFCWYKSVHHIADERSPPIQSIEGFVFPCNPGRSHWTLFFEDIVGKHDIYYDDFNGFPSMKVVRDLREYVRQLAVADEENFSTSAGRQVADYDHGDTVPFAVLGYRQKNGVDCGKYLIANCDSLIDGLNPLDYSARDLKAMTERMALEILLQDSLRSCPLPWLHVSRVAERERLRSTAASIAKFDHDKRAQEFAVLPEERKDAFLLAIAKATHYSQFDRGNGAESSPPDARDLRRSARLEKKRHAFPFESMESAELELRLAEAKGNFSFVACICHDRASLSNIYSARFSYIFSFIVYF